MAQDPPPLPSSASSLGSTSTPDPAQAAAPRRPLPHNYTYPYAPAPDIIRAHQKDAYFQGKLLTQLSDILRALYGARIVQSRTTELHVGADLLYLGLTTLLGNRTLGEEYCDVVSVEAEAGKLPEWRRRAGYVAGVVIVPYMVGLWVPRMRRKMRDALEKLLVKLLQKNGSSSSKAGALPASSADGKPSSPSQPSAITHILRYFLTNLDTITSPAPVYALSLATFYFTGSYYHLSKRFFRLRYILTRDMSSGEAAQRAGYEVLGLLLVLQIAVQAYLHLRETTLTATARGQGAQPSPPPVIANAGTAVGAAVTGPGVEVALSLDPNTFSSNNMLLFESEGGGAGATAGSAEAQTRIAQLTNTPVAAQPRIELGLDVRTGKDSVVMGWLEGQQARKCTLCLEPMRDPSATTCGHLFCWACICEWVRERPECPLCRQECRAQHILPLRA